MGLLSNRSAFGMRRPPSEIAPAPYSLKLNDTLSADADILPTQLDGINGMAPLDGAVPGEVNDGSLDPSIGAAGLKMMADAQPDQPDWMQYRRGEKYRRDQPYSYKPYGQY